VTRRQRLALYFALAFWVWLGTVLVRVAMHEAAEERAQRPEHWNVVRVPAPRGK